jgi:adenosine deaminase
MVLGFALAEADPRWVGVNIVGPEHHPVALRDYALHMRMFAALKRRHPGVRLSLHAGEQTLGLVAPRELRFHVRDAVTVAGAQRIGHGVDIAYETDAQALLQRMARERIAVEINLSSNAAILGVKGADHPLRAYRDAGVPVVLATDDQGVLRSDMSNEYQRAAQEHGLRYADLKQIARDSVEYAFLPGASLWHGRAGGTRVAACAAAPSSPSADCERFLRGSEKARLQWRLEQQFRQFERGFD